MLIKFVSFLIFPILLFAEEFTGKVVSVHDGDTVRVLLDGKVQVKIRLFGIDAPETSQDFGKVSRDELRSLIHSKDVKVLSKGKDRYGRTLGIIFYENQDINLEMVKRGMVWVYRRYSLDKDYLKAEEKAKSEKLGLWKQKNPVPPWEFRRESR
ncbi:MAG TPA: thermonuclease family protein [Leptospiraceae bacterium]|nr:thermonuclease family protein [Leptospiraceae bacterium]HMY69915.1 thermonuclease family protein [Leptospiraceae bacterium]HNF13533.1 thermonuclease family protein [Leptospiraceae bacterium]HNF27602.1 thermonuclease family protein [Leptospiraceae bacterium]HNM06185.1 thermonuclease family protein [Leptospiraceae bacterium]